MTEEEARINEGCYLSSGWLEDLYQAINQKEREVHLGDNNQVYIAEGMRLALSEIMNHI